MLRLTLLCVVAVYALQWCVGDDSTEDAVMCVPENMTVNITGYATILKTMLDTLGGKLHTLQQACWDRINTTRAFNASFENITNEKSIALIVGTGPVSNAVHQCVEIARDSFADLVLSTSVDFMGCCADGDDIAEPLVANITNLFANAYACIKTVPNRCDNCRDLPDVNDQCACLAQLLYRIKSDIGDNCMEIEKEFEAIRISIENFFKVCRKCCSNTKNNYDDAVRTIAQALRICIKDSKNSEL